MRETVYSERHKLLKQPLKFLKMTILKDKLYD